MIDFAKRFAVFVLPLLVLWCVVFWLGMWAIALEKRAPEFTAEKAFPKNHRLVASDLEDAPTAFTMSFKTRDDFEGRYLKNAVGLKEKVSYDDTLAEPALPSEYSVGWLSLRNLPNLEIERIDPGTFVEICNLRTKRACGSVPIEAVVCQKDAATTNCWAAVRLTDDRRRSFVTLAPNGSAPVISVLTHDKGEQRCLSFRSSHTRSRSAPDRSPGSGRSRTPSSKVPHC